MGTELRATAAPDLGTATGWVGFRLDDLFGAQIGKIVAIYGDVGTRRPVWLAVKRGRFGGRHTCMPVNDVVAGAGHAWVPLERRLVRSAPEVEPEHGLTRLQEQALAEHYRFEARLAEIGSGGATDVTCELVPAGDAAREAWEHRTKGLSLWE